MNLQEHLAWYESLSTADSVSVQMLHSDDPTELECQWLFLSARITSVTSNTYRRVEFWNDADWLPVWVDDLASADFLGNRCYIVPPQPHRSIQTSIYPIQELLQGLEQLASP